MSLVIDKSKSMRDCIHFLATDSYMDAAIIKSVLECLKTEARSQINSHQRVYNSVMNDLGPYSAIRR